MSHAENMTPCPQLDMSRLKITLTDTPKPLVDIETATFGANFTDHMAIVSFHPVSGWSAPEIKPYAPLVLDPSSSCFQYGYNVYEGLKAYLGPDGKPRLFRPEMNMRRLERSMARLALPPVDGNAVLELIKRFVQIEKRWIPTTSGYSLYLRPTVIATRPALGTVASDHAMLYVIACPVGPYWARPASLLAVSNMVRAWPGGTGADKVGANYSPTFLAQRDAGKQGYDQVLWLFGEDKQVTEAGVTNVFVVVKRDDDDGWNVWTPPLDGTILPGVTRASCLTLLSDPSFHASVASSASASASAPSTTTTTRVPALHAAEHVFTLADLERWSASNTLLEFFCVGTAVIVSAVHAIGAEGGRGVVVVARVPRYPQDPNGLGPVGSALRRTVLGVQEGRGDDAGYAGWSVVVV